jgi:hypothetical protein
LAALRAGAGGRATWLPMQRVAIALLCATLGGCTASTPPHSLAVPTKYEFRLVSETLKDELARDPMVWVDDDQLVFAAERVVDGKRSMVEGLYRWNDRTRTLEQLAEWGGGFCHSDGVVSYFVRRDGRVYYREGELGKERETDLGPPQVGRVFPQIRCRAVPRDAVPARVTPMLGGGYFEDRRFSPGGPFPYRFYPTLSATPVELPIDPTHTGLDAQRYSEYTKSYIFVSQVFDRERNVTPFVQVFVDGKTALHSLPGGAGLGSALAPLPTARGWLVATPTNGVFLVRDNEVVRIAPGGVRDLAVSPNGCRAALKTSLGGPAFARAHPVYTVNLCE